MTLHGFFRHFSANHRHQKVCCFTRGWRSPSSVVVSRWTTLVFRTQRCVRFGTPTNECCNRRCRSLFFPPACIDVSRFAGTPTATNRRCRESAESALPATESVAAATSTSPRRYRRDDFPRNPPRTFVPSCRRGLVPDTDRRSMDRVTTKTPAAAHPNPNDEADAPARCKNCSRHHKSPRPPWDCRRDLAVWGVLACESRLETKKIGGSVGT